MKTKNIALKISNMLQKEMERTNGTVMGSDTVLDGENAFLFEYENEEVKGKIILDSITKQK